MYLSKKIPRNELDLYEDFIPETYMEQLRRNKFSAGVLTDVFKTEEIRQAIYITYYIDGWLELVWMGYLREDLLPIVKAYIIQSVVMSEKKKYGKNVKGVFFEIHEEEIDDLDLFRQALMMCGFELRETLGNVYELSLDMIGEKEQKFLTKTAGLMKCIPVAEADEKIKQELNDMVTDDNRPVPVGMYINWDEFLADDSLICMKGNKPCGALLLSKKEEYLILDCAYVTDKMALSTMLGRAYLSIKEKYGDSQKVLVPIVVEKTGLLVEKIVPDAVRAKRLEFVRNLRT